MRLARFMGFVFALSLSFASWAKGQDISAEAREKIQMGLFREELGIA